MQSTSFPNTLEDNFCPDLTTAGDSHLTEKTFLDKKLELCENKTKLRYSKHQWAIFISICFISAGCGMSYSIQAPFYPDEAEKKGASSTVSGFVLGVFELVNFIVCPIYGKNIGAIGPKFMLVAGCFVMSVCSILYGCLDLVPAGVPFITLSFAVRIIEALGQAGFVTASYAIIGQEFPDNVASTFSGLETTYGVGKIVGPSVGGILYESGGFPLPFASTGSVLLAASVVTFLILPKLTESPQKSGSLLKLATLPGMAFCYYSVTATAFSVGFLTALLELHLRSFDITPSVMGLMFVIDGATYAVFSPLWGIIVDRYIHRKILCGIGALFISVAFLLIGPATFFPIEPSLWLIIIALAVHGSGAAGVYVAAFMDWNQEAFLNGYPDNIETYGLVSGLWASSIALGCFLGPSVSGMLNDAVGFRNSSLVVVGLHVLVMFLSFGFYHWRKLKSAPNNNSHTIQQQAPVDIPLKTEFRVLYTSNTNR